MLCKNFGPFILIAPEYTRVATLMRTGLLVNIHSPSWVFCTCIGGRPYMVIPNISNGMASFCSKSLINDTQALVKNHSHEVKQ